MAFSQRVPLTDVVMTFLLRAARSAPVRPFVELDRGPCWLFAVVVVVVVVSSSPVSGSG